MIGMVPCSPRREHLGRGRPSGAVGAPLDHELLEVLGGDVDLGVHAAAPTPHSARDLERGDGHVGDGRARLQAAGDRDHRDAVGARQRRPARRRVVTTTRVAPSDPGGLVAGERLLGVARVGGAQHRRVGRRPRRQPVGPRGQERPRGVCRRARPARARRRSPSRPCRRRPGRRASPTPRVRPTRPSTARRAGARGSRGCPSSMVGRVDRRDRLAVEPAALRIATHERFRSTS